MVVCVAFFPLTGSDGLAFGVKEQGLQGGAVLDEPVEALVRVLLAEHIEGEAGGPDAARTVE